MSKTLVRYSMMFIVLVTLGHGKGWALDGSWTIDLNDDDWAFNSNYIRSAPLTEEWAKEVIEFKIALQDRQDEEDRLALLAYQLGSLESACQYMYNPGSMHNPGSNQ